MRLIDGDQLEQRLLDEAARIMSEDLYGKDRQRMARGLQKAAEICRATETATIPIEKAVHLDTEEVAKIVMEKIDAVPVVRCGECMWYYEREGCFFSTAEITPDAFCSYGERRDDETD